MDIKESLGKIEQYWQIIRNLHFHIEQEGQISPEEFALLDKYLQVISGKYASLVVADPITTPKKIETLQEKSVYVAPEVVEQPIEKVEEPKIVVEETLVEVVSVHIADEPKAVEPINEVEQKEVIVPAQPSFIPQDLQAKPAQDSTISSFLERMLEKPSEMPSSPVKIESTPSQQKPTSFNDRMMESRASRGDLNSRIKKSISESISLNEKFEFIRELFGNNPVEYATALSFVDAREDQEKAWLKLEAEFAQKYNWENKPAATEKLKNALNRRYA